jgi:hypothetical protein
MVIKRKEEGRPYVFGQLNDGLLREIYNITFRKKILLV